jgi:N-acetylglucosamine kinase-like BadF-type ATPase
MYYLGFDGGGTKTECALLDHAGHLLGQASAGASNPLRIGLDQAFAALSEATYKVLGAARLEACQIHGVCAGLAGAGRSRVVKRVMAFLVDTFPQAGVHVTTDLEVALEAAVGPGQGVVLIAGTGSAAYGRNAAGRTARAGGQGPWIGDEGSAFDIGRRAMAAVAQARDRLAPVTILADIIPAALDCPSWEALTERIAQNPDDVFPRIFPLVVEAADAEDDAAREILFTAALALGRLASSVIRRLGLADKKFVLAKAGGVFGHSALLESGVDALLAGAARRAQIQSLGVVPAVAAAQLARRVFAAAPGKLTHGAKG